MNRKELTKTFMMTSNWKSLFDLHGLYKNISAFLELRDVHVGTHTPSQTRDVDLQCWNNVGPASLTVDQHYSSIGSTYRVCWDSSCEASCIIQFLSHRIHSTKERWEVPYNMYKMINEIHVLNAGEYALSLQHETKKKSSS